MVGWHHRLDGHEFEQTLGDGEAQGGLVHCSPWSRKGLDPNCLIIIIKNLTENTEAY